MYLTFAEYVAYGGTLSEAAFNRLEFNARKSIDQQTFGRLKGETVINDSVKRLMFELVNTINNSDVSSVDYRPVISSESVGSYKVSYQTELIPTNRQRQKIISELISNYLADEKDSAGTPLLYCGT